MKEKAHQDRGWGVFPLSRGLAQSPCTTALRSAVFGDIHHSDFLMPARGVHVGWTPKEGDTDGPFPICSPTSPSVGQRV